MIVIRLMLVSQLGVGILLMGCERKKSAEETFAHENDASVESAEVTQGKASSLPSGNARFDARGLIKAGRELTANYAEVASESLNQLNLSELKSRAQGLGKAIGKEDFDEAEILADKLGQALDSGTIGACVSFFRTQSEKGTAVAQEEIRKYMNSVELSPEEKKCLQDLHAHIATMDTEAKINLVSLVVALACEAKLGPGSSRLGFLLGDVLREGLKSIER
jgi:hypothetical protein